MTRLVLDTGPIDACLVRMTELDPKATIVTLDSDFGIYRRNVRQLVPTITPEA